MNYNCVLMGDFNCKPETIQYIILTNPESIDLLNEDYHVCDLHILKYYNISLENESSFKSVYKEFSQRTRLYKLCFLEIMVLSENFRLYFCKKSFRIFKVNKVDNLDENQYISRSLCQMIGQVIIC